MPITPESNNQAAPSQNINNNTTASSTSLLHHPDEAVDISLFGEVMLPHDTLDATTELLMKVPVMDPTSIMEAGLKPSQHQQLLFGSIKKGSSKRPTAGASGSSSAKKAPQQSATKNLVVLEEVPPELQGLPEIFGSLADDKVEMLKVMWQALRDSHTNNSGPGVNGPPTSSHTTSVYESYQRRFAKYCQLNHGTQPNPFLVTASKVRAFFKDEILDDTCTPVNARGAKVALANLFRVQRERLGWTEAENPVTSDLLGDIQAVERAHHQQETEAARKRRAEATAARALRESKALEERDKPIHPIVRDSLLNVTKQVDGLGNSLATLTRRVQVAESAVRHQTAVLEVLLRDRPDLLEMLHTASTPTASQSAVRSFEAASFLNDTDSHEKSDSGKSKLIRETAAILSQLSATTAEELMPPEIYRMSPKVRTVAALWQEWEQGLDGGPAIKDLESLRGAAWCPNSHARNNFLRKKPIIELVPKVANAKGMTCPQAALHIDRRLSEMKGKTLTWLGKHLEDNAGDISDFV